MSVHVSKRVMGRLCLCELEALKKDVFILRFEYKLCVLS